MPRTRQHTSYIQTISFQIGIGLNGFFPEYHTIEIFKRKRLDHRHTQANNFPKPNTIDKFKYSSCSKSAKRKGNKMECKRKFKNIENY